MNARDGELVFEKAALVAAAADDETIAGIIRLLMRIDEQIARLIAHYEGEGGDDEATDS